MLNSYRFAILLMVFFGGVGIQAARYHDEDLSLACSRNLPAPVAKDLAATSLEPDVNHVGDAASDKRMAPTDPVKVSHGTAIVPASNAAIDDAQGSHAQGVSKASPEKDATTLPGVNPGSISKVAIQTIKP